MANTGKIPGSDVGEAIESRRSTVPEADPSEPAAIGKAEGPEGPVSDLPEFGELSPESARPTPLDEIAEAEREQAPRD